MKRLSDLRLYEKCRSLLMPFRRSALLTPDFEIIYLQPESLADIATLPQSIEVSHRYLQLNDGDITIMNDPYSGGAIVTGPTLVMGVGTRTVKGTTPAELLVASRITLVPRVKQAKTIDEEGLRIPPTPYLVRGEPNLPIIEALSHHPSAPEGIMPAVKAEIDRLLQLRETLKRELSDDTFNRAVVREFLRHCENEFSRRLDELPENAGVCEIDVGESESIKLKVEIHDGHVLFDFTGTTPGKSIFMTDSATMGAAIGTFLSLLRENIPINTGVLSRFEIKAPKGSLVNATFPRPVYLGHTDGLNLLANAVSMAFYKIDPKLGWASSGVSHCSLEIAPQSGKSYWCSLPVGLGASNVGPGLDGAYAWRRFLYLDSIECIEKKMPFEFVFRGFRTHSGGPGRYAGGRGAVDSIKLLEDATISWNYLEPPHKPEGLAGGKSAQGTEIVVQFADGQKQRLSTAGRMDLHRGDIVTVLSSGGGGFGAPDSDAQT